MPRQVPAPSRRCLRSAEDRRVRPRRSRRPGRRRQAAAARPASGAAPGLQSDPAGASAVSVCEIRCSPRGTPICSTRPCRPRSAAGWSIRGRRHDRSRYGAGAPADPGSRRRHNPRPRRYCRASRGIGQRDGPGALRCQTSQCSVEGRPIAAGPSTNRRRRWCCRCRCGSFRVPWRRPEGRCRRLAPGSA